LEGSSLEEWLFDWKQLQSGSTYGSTTGIFVYVIWWAKKLVIFQNIVMHSEMVAGRFTKMSFDSKNELKKIKERKLVMSEVK
jgi:hypothetical protein